MADGMPSTYDTQATATSTSTSTSSVFFDKTMFRTPEVMLKIGEAVVLLLGLISIACAAVPQADPAGWFDFVASVGLVVAVVLTVLYVMHVRDKIAVMLKLNFVEMVYGLLWAFFCLTAAIATIVHGSKYSGQKAFIAAGFFALVASVLYCVDGFTMYRAWRSGQTRSATQTTHHVTTPASPAY